MILRKERAHLVLKTPPAMVRLLLVDVSDERIKIGGTNRKQAISSLPGEIRNTTPFHPRGRCRLDLRDNLRGGFSGRQCHRKVNVIAHTTYAKAFATEFARRSGQISV